MKKIFLIKTISAALIVLIAKTALAKGLSAQLEDKAVDNFQGYGEKYHCDIITKEQKKYSLDLVWNVVPNTKTRFPTWSESFSYKLSNLEKSISEIGFDGVFPSYANIDFNYSENLFLKFHGQHTLNTRAGVYSTNAEIILIQDGMEKLKVQKFDFEYSFLPDYVDSNKLVRNKIILDIVDSQCEKL